MIFDVKMMWLVTQSLSSVPKSHTDLDRFHNSKESIQILNFLENMKTPDIL